MFSTSDIYAFTAKVREFFALSDPSDPYSYVYLLLFVFLNAALLAYRSSLSIGAIVYALLLGLMYAVSLFWHEAPAIFFWLYGGAAFYVILLEGRRVLTPFVLMNFFNCLVVIPFAAGGKGALSLDMFFEEPLPAPLVGVFWDLNSMSHTFLLLFCPVFVAAELCLYWRRRRAAKKAREEREALLAKRFDDLDGV